jgi:hypothetical protein
MEHCIERIELWIVRIAIGVVAARLLMEVLGI